MRNEKMYWVKTTANKKLKVMGRRRVAFSLAQFVTAIFFFGSFLSASGQTAISATLKSDSDHITIGDHLNVRVSIRHPKSVKVLMPLVKDSLGNMDFIASSKVDTIQEATDEVLSQNYVVSAYDSGVFHAGPVTVFFHNTSGGVDSVLSNEIPVAVATLPVDTARPFKPIKAPLAVPFSWREFIPYIIGAVLLLILIVVLIVLYVRYQKHKPVAPARPIPKDPAHIWARKELKKLEDEKLWQKDQVKLYYSRLTEILRLYLEYRYKWLALESTTEEIEAGVDNYNMKEKGKENLLKILRTADLVKFAKMLPDPETNINAMESAGKFIDFTEPKEEDEKKKE